jgi:hypothetical protein
MGIDSGSGWTDGEWRGGLEEVHVVGGNQRPLKKLTYTIVGLKYKKCAVERILL